MIPHTSLMHWIAALLTVTHCLIHAAETSNVRRIFLHYPRHDGNVGILPLQSIESAAWIWHPDYVGVVGPGEKDVPEKLIGRWKDRLAYFDGGWRGPVFLRFRCDFDAAPTTLVFHVSADERYELLLDGRRISRGPDRSCVSAWSYKTYAVDLAPGRHRMEAIVWSLGPLSPMAQLTWRGGFVLKADGSYDSRLTTGKGPWQVAKLDGLLVEPPEVREIFGVGGELTAEGCGPQWKEGHWVPAAIARGPVRETPYGIWTAGWRLFPSTLPDMLDRRVHPGRIVAVMNSDDPDLVFRSEAASPAALVSWNGLLGSNAPVVVPAHSTLTVLWDLDDYYCAYPVVQVSEGRGAQLEWGWAESLYLPDRKTKGNRNEWIGKVFVGMCDRFRPDGGTSQWFSTHWWRAGRWCRLRIRTADHPLRIEALALDETRYPLESEAEFDAPIADLSAMIRLAVRGLQMCSHETFMDCPFYEQLMYVGDSRLEMLVTHVLTRDTRLVRRGIELFDRSRSHSGFVHERFPAHEPQLSTTFSMIWVLMLRDYAWWRGDLTWVRDRAVGMRAMLELFEHYRNPDGLLENLPGWSFVDWVPAWKVGYAPDGRFGVSAINNLLFVLALQAAADIEEALGESALAERWRRRAGWTAAAIRSRFWDEARGMIADDLARSSFSEHAQCLALLADLLPRAEAQRTFAQLLNAPDLHRTTIYFSHYLFETFQKMGRGDLVIDRLRFWRDLVHLGLRTPVEKPEPSRSDCHAWGSHPLYHLFATTAGVRPASPGFRTVRIEPQPGPLPYLRARLPHPAGHVEVNMTFTNGGCRAQVVLPADVQGEFVWRGRARPLSAGEQTVIIQAE